jgi:hypothetical protein
MKTKLFRNKFPLLGRGLGGGFFLLIAACLALPNMLQAQWTYTEWRFTVYSVTQIGTAGEIIDGIDQCYLHYLGMKNNATKSAALSYPTRELCESTRQELVSKHTSCVSVVCGPCTSNSFSFGPPGGINGGSSDGGFSDKFGNTDITGTSQGDPFYTSNPFDALQDAYDQKNLQNEKLLGNDDTKFANFTGGRPASAEGIFNWAKQKRPLSNNDVRRNRAGGRPGAMGGFNIQPTGSSAANRYNGQRGTFGLGGGQPSTYKSDGDSGELTREELSTRGREKVEAGNYEGGAGDAWDAIINGKDPMFTLNEKDQLARGINIAVAKGILKDVPRKKDIDDAYNEKIAEIKNMPEETDEQWKKKKERYENLKKSVEEYDKAYKAFNNALTNKKDPTCSVCKATAEAVNKGGNAALTTIADI